MTTTFYFNEVLPAKTELNVVSVFEQTVIKAASLARKLHMVIPVVTSDTSDKVKICGMELQAIINGSSNREVKTIGWQLFTHNNTISQYDGALEESVAEGILEANYQFDEQDATNLAVANKMEWPVLSMPLSEALMKDKLCLTSESADSLEVLNYYAQDDTSAIEKWIAAKVLKTETGLARLKALLGEDRVIVCSEFEKEWNDATTLCQDIVFERFKFAVDNNRLFPVVTDDKRIQDLEVKGDMAAYELRQKGQGVRVYFGYSEDGSKIVLASFYTKAQSSGDEQKIDVKKVPGRIKKALAMAQL